MSKDNVSQLLVQHSEQVRKAVIRAFEQAYEDAGLRGLCSEGRYEAAIEAARKLDLGTSLNAPKPGTGQQPMACP